jgi:two-component system, sensor histidine kinase and response regulator
MKVDLDACLAAGMNDHITKPIDRRQLIATLRRWLPARPNEQSPAVATQVPERLPAEPSAAVANGAPQRGAVPELEGVDVSGTLQRLGVDRATLERMLLRFAEGQQELLEALRAAVITGDSAMAARHAHAIVGASGNLGADALRSAAKALEQAGRDGRTDLTDLLAVVEERAAVVFSSIETLRPSAQREADSAGRPFDSAVAGAALDRLTTALDNYDVSSASGALADLGTSGLPAWATDDLGRLRGCVDAYEYGEAQGIAKRLSARVRAGETEHRPQRRLG